jgi:hypothetical protein
MNVLTGTYVLRKTGSPKFIPLPSPKRPLLRNARPDWNPTRGSDEEICVPFAEGFAGESDSSSSSIGEGVNICSVAGGDDGSEAGVVSKESRDEFPNRLGISCKSRLFEPKAIEGEDDEVLVTRFNACVTRRVLSHRDTAFQ